MFDADDAMARITAERLVQHLEASGFVLMKRPAREAPTTNHMPNKNKTNDAMKATMKIDVGVNLFKRVGVATNFYR